MVKHCLGILLVLCSFAPSSFAQAATEAATFRSPLKIILLKPTVRIDDQTIYEHDPYGGKEVVAPRGTASALEYEQLLLDAARHEAGPKFPLADVDELKPTLKTACKKLEPLASRLARGNVNAQATEELSHLAAPGEQYAVLAQFLHLETGLKGYSYSTGTASSTASTLVQVALVSGTTGKVIWKSERLVRFKALKPTDGALAKTLAEVYRNFNLN
jgi:hypothetical protein